MYIREKTVKGMTYYQVIQGYRDNAGRVRHRNIISLGQSETIEDAIGEVRRHQSRIRRRLTVLVATAAGYLDPATTPRWIVEEPRAGGCG